MKKLLALLLCVVMILSMTACGANGGTETTAATNPPAQNQNETPSTQDTTPAAPITVTVEVFDRGNMPAEYGTPTDNKWVKMLQDDIMADYNIDLQYVGIPRSEEVTKLQALIAAGDAPDLIFCYDKQSIINWIDNDALTDLTPYLQDGVGKELADFITEEGLAYARFGEGQYAVCFYQTNETALARYSSFIRKDWVEAVGMTLDEANGHYVITPSQLKEVLVKIKEAGLCDFPYMITNQEQPLLGAFLTEEDIAPESMIQSHNDSYWTVPGVKDGYAFINELYNLGLINPDFPLHTKVEQDEMIASENMAFCNYSYYGYEASFDAVHNANPDAEFVAVEVVHEDGTPGYVGLAAPNGIYCMIPKTCENPEAAITVLKWFMTDETAHMVSSHGIVGEHVTYDDGAYVTIDAEYNAADRISCNDLVLPMNGDQYCSGKDAQNAQSVANLYQNYHEKTAKAYETAWLSVAVSPGHFVPVACNAQISALADYSAELTENTKKLFVESIMAPDGTFGEVWSELYESFWNEGGKQYAEEALAWYQSVN